MKLASITVAYHSDIKDLRHNLASYANNVKVLMLWDNSETPHDLRELKSAFPNLVVHQDGVNHGLSKPYNWAINYAMMQGCSHLMTMDQDSIFENFPHYKKQIESFYDTTVGIFTCPINNDISENGYRETTVCQSGSVYTMEMLNSIGGFREDLFIGMVDAEMSLRAIEKGYKIYQFTGCNLVQHIGSGRRVHFLGKDITVSDYSPLRHYYDSRNRILMWHEFPYDYTTWQKLQHHLSRIKLIIKILLFENQKYSKTIAIIRGTFNGISNRIIPF